jgi:[ribosomal protein S5]-alanine N-acetyltransferase
MVGDVEMMEILETDRLILKEWTEADAPQLFALAKNPNVGPHAGWKPHADEAESLEVIQTLFLTSLVWKVTDRKTGALVGSLGLETDRFRPGIASKELGYWIGEEYWGKGLATEAAIAAMTYGFEKLNLEIIGICTGPHNLRSQRVIEKLGFTFEGIHRHCYKIYDGTVRDSLTYSMLKEEWAERRLKWEVL